MRPSRGPRAAQETPKDLQNAMQKNDKKIQKNAAVVKNALSRRSQKTRFLEPIFMTKFALFQIEFIQVAWSFFKNLQIGAHCENRAAQKDQHEPIQ